MSYNLEGELLKEEEATYTFGEHYNGAARRNIKPYGNKGSSSARLGHQAGHTKIVSKVSLICTWGEWKAALFEGKIILQDRAIPEKKSWM